MLNVEVECKRHERRFKSPGSAVRDSCPSAGRDVSVITNRREGCFCYYVVSVIPFCRVHSPERLVFTIEPKEQQAHPRRFAESCSLLKLHILALEEKLT